jgi:hypothetical protein
MARSALPTPPSTPEARLPSDERLAARKKEIVDRVMAKFTVLFAERMDELCGTADQLVDDAEGAKTANGSGRSTSKRNTTDRRAQPQKRRLSESSDDPSSDGETGGDGGGGNGNGRKDRIDSKRLRTPRRLACPFFKHDPETYGAVRTCCGPGWEQVHRLK